MNKLVIVLIFLISGSCFARSAECENLIKRYDKSFRECFYIILIRGSGKDEDVLVKAYGSLKAADAKMSTTYNQWREILKSMSALRPKCAYIGSKEGKATDAYLKPLREKYGYTMEDYKKDKNMNSAPLAPLKKIMDRLENEFKNEHSDAF